MNRAARRSIEEHADRDEDAGTGCCSNRTRDEARCVTPAYPRRSLQRHHGGSGRDGVVPLHGGFRTLQLQLEACRSIVGAYASLAAASNECAVGRGMGDVSVGTCVDSATVTGSSGVLAAAGCTLNTGFHKLGFAGVAHRRGHVVHRLAVRTWREAELSSASAAEHCVGRIASPAEMALHMRHSALPHQIGPGGALQYRGALSGPLASDNQGMRIQIADITEERARSRSSAGSALHTNTGIGLC